jgi:hypothetical protein
MATATLATVAAALSLLFRAEMTTQINSVVVLPFLLPVVDGEGKALNYTVEFTGAANAAAVADGTARSSSDADAEVEVPATLPWAIYDKVTSVGDLLQAAANRSFNSGSAGAIRGDLLVGKTVRQTRRLAFGIANALYAGNETASPAQIAGAARAIDSSGTFAGIDPTTYTEWVSTEQTGALSSVSFAVFDAFINAIYDASGERPEFVTCPSNVWLALKALFVDYQAHVVREFMLARGGGPTGESPRAVKLTTGMEAFEIDGIPIVKDRWATANTMHAWNTNYVQIVQLDPYAGLLAQGADAIQELFRVLAAQNGVQIPREAIEGMMARSPGVRPSIKLLGDRGHSKEAMVRAFLQVEWKRRNTQGKYLFT